MLRSHQGAADRPPTPAGVIQPPQGDHGEQGHQENFRNPLLFFIIIIMYLYSAQYLHILQDSKRYLTNPTVQIQPQLTSN